MKRGAGLLVGALALAAPAASTAAWSVIATDSEYFVEFDPALVREQGSYAMAWTRLTFTLPKRTPDANAVKYQSQLQLHAIDCAATTVTIVGVVLHAGALGRGEVVQRSIRPRAEWRPQPPPPGSLSDVTVRLACAEAARRKTAPNGSEDEAQ
jgi:hypothetical protein